VVLSIILLVLILVLLYVLFVPIIIVLNTESNEYYVQLKGLAKAHLEAHDKEILQIRLHTLFRDFYFYPLQKKTKKVKKIEEKKSHKRKKKFRLRTFFNVLRSFKVKRFNLDLDTGDYVRNAQLYPISTFLQYRSGAVKINFEGRNRMELCLQNRPIHIIKSFINI
jgi:hypothetical protein